MRLRAGGVAGRGVWRHRRFGHHLCHRGRGRRGGVVAVHHRGVGAGQCSGRRVFHGRGNYSGTKAELDNIRRIRAIEERHISLYPDGERREVREILAQKGLSGDVLEEATDAITANHDNWINLMVEGEYGLGSVDPIR